LVTYGYGFGDEHINRAIRDMLTIPTTHLLIISFDDKNNRIQGFLESSGSESQMSLMVGSHFGDLGTIVGNYLPRPAVDVIATRMAEMLRRRRFPPADSTEALSESEASDGGSDDEQ
jgi:hypothetical protein